MFERFAKKPEAVECFNATEAKRLWGPKPVGWAAWTADELHLYRALVRELSHPLIHRTA